MPELAHCGIVYEQITELSLEEEGDVYRIDLTVTEPSKLLLKALEDPNGEVFGLDVAGDSYRMESPTANYHLSTDAFIDKELDAGDETETLFTDAFIHFEVPAATTTVH